MATASDVITSARWDLLDEQSSLYSDAMLLDFLNRGLRPLCVTLASLSSDWVNESTTLTLAAAAEYVTLPTNFISEIDVKISSTTLIKKSIPYVRNERIDSTAGQPGYFAIQGTSLMFEKAADVEYSITLEYHKRADVVTINADMPFNDEFNDTLRQFISLIAKSRETYTSEDGSKNQYTYMSELQIQTFFQTSVFARTVSRNFTPNLDRTDF